MFVSCQSAIRNQEVAIMEISLRTIFLAELAVIANKNVW